MAKKNWIAEATKNKGGLHRSLDVPEGKKISKSKLKKAAKSKGKVGKQARLAETLEGFNKAKKAVTPKGRQRFARDAMAKAKAKA